MIKSVLLVPSRNGAGEQAPPNSQPNHWKPYVNGKVIDGVSMAVPPGWTVRYDKSAPFTYSSFGNADTLNFDLIPPGQKVNRDSIGWMGWGALMINVLPARKDIQSFIDSYGGVSHRDIAANDLKLGSNHAYYLTASHEEFTPRYVVLGSQHSYEIGFSQNGASGFYKRIVNEILPFASFE